MARKGQYTLVEQVILFALGISITIGFLFTFRNLEENVAADVKDSQAELVSEYVASTSIELVESGMEGRIGAPVPENIASDTYAIRLGEGGVRVQVTGEQKVAPLYGLETRADAGGAVESGQGAIALTFSDGQLRVAEVE